MTIQHGLPGRQPTPLSLQSPANTDPGLFGRMFEGLPPLTASDDALEALANAMKDADPRSPGGNSKIPAGITYFGQFIDHDVTLDVTPLAEKRADRSGKTNFRTPRVDLDSLYGLGPDVMPHLYHREQKLGFIGNKFVLGLATESDKLITPGTFPDIEGGDLPRGPEGHALIGDPRNDENLIVAQTHLAFLKFHNHVVDKLRGTVADDRLFLEARRTVTWHYQWMVLHEFLELLTGEPGITARILNEGRKFYRFRSRPFMPVEFSAAAYRFGHSMIREGYSHNIVFRPGGATVATLPLLFHFTAKSGGIGGRIIFEGPFPAGLPGMATLPSNWVIDWRRFHDLGTPQGTPNFEFNVARKIDPFLIPTLHTLPGFPAGREGNLAFRNLKRGVLLGLPSGQTIAAHMKVKPLTKAQLSSGPDGAVAAANRLIDHTPLWYYILKEAEQLGKGEHLGPVGKTIVAEVFVGLVAGDPQSYLSATPQWTPSGIGPVDGRFTFADLLSVVGDINPLGDG